MPLLSHTPESILCTQRGERAKLACDCCGTHFEKRAKYVRADLKRGRKNFYCSVKCRDVKTREELDAPLGFHCDECGQPVYHKRDRRSKHAFCSKRCAGIHSNKTVKPQQFRKERFVLRSYMEFETPDSWSDQNEIPSKPRVVSKGAPVEHKMKCEGCNTDLLRTDAQLRKTKHGKPFCSKSCRMRHYNAHILTRTSNQRSKAEDILLGMIREGFPDLNLIPNDRAVLPSSLEIDIHIPEAKLAIELNGPVHYLPIYGDERLAKVRMNDAQKHLEIHDRGLRLLVLDISRLNSAKRQLAFLTAQYTDVIKPLISEVMEAREGVSPTIASPKTTSVSEP